MQLKHSIKVLLIIILAVINAPSIHSQIEFNHSAGAAIVVNIIGQDYGAGYAVEGIYNPKIHFNNSRDDLSISVGVPLGVAFNFYNNANLGNVGSLLIDLPLIADVNLGHGASKQNETDYFGGFIGVGVRYLYERIFGTYIEGASAYLFGPTVNGGLRILTKGNNMSWTIFSSYTYNLGTLDSHLISVGFLYNIGL